jgi:hypothetical protein
VNTLLPTVQDELALAKKAGKKAKVDVASIQAALDIVAQTITETAAPANFADAKAKLAAAKDSLTAAQTTLETAGFKK